MTQLHHLSGEHLRRPAPYQPPDSPGLISVNDVDELYIDGERWVRRERVSDWSPFLLWLAAAAIAGAMLWWAIP